MNKTNFQRFIMIVRSAGFIDPSMIRSQNVLNFAYIIYLLSVSIKVSPAKIEKLVRRWLVMAIYVMMQSEINIAIKDRSPKEYFSEIIENCKNGFSKYGAIVDMEELKENFKSHCIPKDMENWTFDDYNDFLIQRRILVSEKIRRYYKKL
ncbi:MAG: hypothetical protein FWG89_00595 [Treponema sp.]|nr:hypothetical protein [Treponema sp.]